MTQLINPQNTIGQAITRGRFAKQAQMLPVPIDFSVDPIAQVSLNILHGISNALGIDGAQSLWIDNSNNPQNTVVAFSNGFTITCPAFAIGIFPLLIAMQTVNFVATSTGAVLVNFYFTNTKEQPAIWSAKFPLSGTINVTGSTIIASVPPVGYADHSAALSLGNNLVLPANGNRVGFFIKNPATPVGQGIAAPEPLYVSWTGAIAAAGAVGTYELLPGETVTAAGLGGVSTQAVNIWSPTALHRVTIKDF